jgi:hypothetical protein
VVASPEGNELRQYADAQEALASDVSALGGRFGNLAPDCRRAITGFPFRGPFEEEVQARIAQVTKLLELAEAQLKQAAGRIRSTAGSYRTRAVVADTAYAAQQAMDDMFGGS